MAPPPAPPEEPITLPSGVTLTDKQSKAAWLYVCASELTADEIAEQAGYAQRAGLSAFLYSRNGKEAVNFVIKQQLSHAGRIGLQTMIRLAERAKSENVRQLAAADLLDRAGFARRPWGADQEAPRQGSFSININIGDEKPAMKVVGEDPCKNAQVTQDKTGHVHKRTDTDKDSTDQDRP